MAESLLAHLHSVSARTRSQLAQDKANTQAKSTLSHGISANPSHKFKAKPAQAKPSHGFAAKSSHGHEAELEPAHGRLKAKSAVRLKRLWLKICLHTRFVSKTSHGLRAKPTHGHKAKPSHGYEAEPAHGLKAKSAVRLERLWLRICLQT